MAIPSRHRDRHAPAHGTFFVTSNTAGQRFLLQTERSARLLIEVLYRCRADGKFQLHEFVVMPNHFHALITPARTVSDAMRYIKGRYAREAAERFGFRLGVWQRGFSDHQIRGRADYLHHKEYIFDNPVRAGLCSDASEYPYSSACPAFTLDEPPEYLRG